MQRIVSQQYAETIGRALSAVPPFIMSRLEHVHFLTGTDPIWAGLHRFPESDDGRSRLDTAHCCYPWNQEGLPRALRQTTIVLPVPETHWTLLHELGHALDEVLGFRHTAYPVDDYAAKNSHEAFACAFEAWLSPGYEDYDALMANDPATVALFTRLAMGDWSRMMVA